MIYSVDFGGSTIDVVSWKRGKPVRMRSYERYEEGRAVGPEEFFASRVAELKGAGKIFVTGGKSLAMADFFNGVPVSKTGEIEAIGRGGLRLFEKYRKNASAAGVKRLLVVSMGTGTCMVAADARGNKSKEVSHVGGTGVGGGTFMGLCARLLGKTSPSALKKMFLRGDRKKVDLSVYDIVGGGIGLVPGSATASNLGKISRSIDFSKDDLAAGIAGLVGQTIGMLAVFAAKAYGCDLVLLCGKLTEMEQVTEAVLSAGRMYRVWMLVPEGAGFVSALGAYADKRR